LLSHVDSSLRRDCEDDPDSFVNLARIQNRKEAEDDNNGNEDYEENGEDANAAYFDQLPDGTNFETKEDTSIDRRGCIETDDKILKGIIERGSSLNDLAKKIRKEPRIEVKPEISSTMPTISESEE
jgi:hypothetical protein